MSLRAAKKAIPQKSKKKTPAARKLSLLTGSQRISASGRLKKKAVALKNKTAFISNGLAEVSEFEQLKALSGFSAEALAALIGTTTRTLQNKRAGKTSFDLPITERLRKIYQLFEEGTQVMGTREFSKWLKQPAYGMDYAVPVDLLGEAGGLDRVLNELSAIKYGDTV